MKNVARVVSAWWAPERRGASLVTAVVALAVGVSCAIEVARIVVTGAGLGPSLAIAATIVGALLSIRLPWPGLAIAALATVVAGAVGWQPIVEWSCAVFLLVSLATRRGRPWLGALIAAPPVAVGTALVSDAGGPFATALGAIISVAAGAAVGFGLRTQWQYRAVLEQRAADALATREIEADRRVAEERLRIARDLHDVVGHEVAVVSMRLGVAEVTLPEDADDARQALAEARVGVRNVLTETQNILAILRGSDESASSEPTPGLESIPRLLDSYRRLGLELTVDLRVPPEKVDAGVGLAVYRVLQEALTNAHRYGRGSASVTCAIAADRLRLEVTNTRELGKPRREGGLGLVGMRERVTAAGGTVSVQENGVAFAVVVDLPASQEGAS